MDRAGVALMDEPLHPVIQLYERAEICETLDAPYIGLPDLHITEVAPLPHAIYYDICVTHVFTHGNGHHLI